MRNVSRKRGILTVLPVALLLGYSITAQPQEPTNSRETKDNLRVTRLYEGSSRGRDSVAVIVTATRDLRSPKYSKAGIAGVGRVDERSVDPDSTDEIECLPGKHKITFLVQFRPDNVPEGTLAVSSTRYDKTLDLRAGYRYRIVFHPNSDEADIEEFGVETRKDSITEKPSGTTA